MSQGPEDALVKLYKENEIEESQFNDTWLQNKNDIENFIYKKELDINTLNNYSQNLITYYKNKIKQVNDLKSTRSNDTEKNLEGDATIQILQEENIPKIIEKYGEKYDSSSAAEVLIPQYKDLIGKDTTKDVIQADYDERFKVIRYDLLIKEYEKNISDIEIDLKTVIEFDKLMKDKLMKEKAAIIIQRPWKKRQQWLYDNQLIPYVGSEVVEPSESRYIIPGCKDTVVDIPADCDGAILKKEIANKMRADNPEELCLTEINNKIEKINDKCSEGAIESVTKGMESMTIEGGGKNSKGGTNLGQTRKGGKRTKKNGKKTKKKGNTVKNKQIIIGGTIEKMIDYVELFDVYKDTLSYGLLQDKLYINLSVLTSKLINSLDNPSSLYTGYFDNEIYNIKSNITDIRSLINSESSVMVGGGQGFSTLGDPERDYNESDSDGESDSDDEAQVKETGDALNEDVKEDVSAVDQDAKKVVGAVAQEAKDSEKALVKDAKMALAQDAKDAKEFIPDVPGNDFEAASAVPTPGNQGANPESAVVNQRLTDLENRTNEIKDIFERYLLNLQAEKQREKKGAVQDAVSDAVQDASTESSAQGKQEKEEITQETKSRIDSAVKQNEEEVKKITESLTKMVDEIKQLTDAIVEQQTQLDKDLKTEETELTDDMNKVFAINEEIQEENKKIEEYNEEEEKINEGEREIEKEKEGYRKIEEENWNKAMIGGPAITESNLKLANNNKYASRSMLTQNLMNFLKDCDILNSVPEWRAEISTAVLAFVTGSAENPNNLQRIVLDLSYKYFNLILLGTPGVGKTYTAGIIGKALHNCGFLTVGKKIDIKKPDLIGEYTGQTAPKVYKELTRGLGNVIFIDEAYSIAGAKDENTNKYDSYGQEALDALTDYTSEHIGLLSVIAAGYEYEMNKQFLDVNTGLRRRFPTRLTLPRYELKSFWKILELYLKKFVEQGDTMNKHKACFELQNLMFNYQCNPNPTIKLSKDWKDLSPNMDMNSLTKISIVLTDSQNQDFELSSINKFNELISNTEEINSNKVLLFNEDLRTKLPDDSQNITYTYIKSYIIYTLCSPTLYNGDFYRSQSDNLKKFASSILEYILLQNIENPTNQEIEDFYFGLFFRENPNTKIENLKYVIENDELKFKILANPEDIYIEDKDGLTDIVDYNEEIINKFISLGKNLTTETQLEYIYISILCRAYRTAKVQSQRKDGPDETDSWWFFDKTGFQIIVDQIGKKLSVIIKNFTEKIPDNPNSSIDLDPSSVNGSTQLTTPDPDTVSGASTVPDESRSTVETSGTSESDQQQQSLANSSLSSIVSPITPDRSDLGGGGKKGGSIKNKQKSKRRRKKNKKKNKKITFKNELKKKH